MEKEQSDLLVVSVKMSPALAHQARVAAATEGRARSALIRDAVYEYLERYNLLPVSTAANKEARQYEHA